MFFNRKMVVSLPIDLLRRDRKGLSANIGESSYGFHKACGPNLKKKPFDEMLCMRKFEPLAQTEFQQIQTYTHHCVCLVIQDAPVARRDEVRAESLRNNLSYAFHQMKTMIRLSYVYHR